MTACLRLSPHNYKVGRSSGATQMVDSVYERRQRLLGDFFRAKKG